MIEAGKVLQQRYRIDKLIGQGGMGAVYVATDERFGSTVAIKETLFMDSNFRKAIEREARLLNSLKHSALPRVTDHFEEDNSQFLVMEYITGEDLSTIIDRERRPFEIADILNWADQLLDALEFLHTQETPVIHRDIKPQNLKLTPRGQIVLLDFGLAKGNPTDAVHQTAAKSIFGYSRNYASLEQIQGTGTDPRSDIYSLASTLYHLLTGVAPEDALTRAMSVLSQQPDPLVPANILRPAIPSGVAGVLQKALSLNASERPESAGEMRKMLRENEKYGYLADAAIETNRTTDAPVSARSTSVMGEPAFFEPAKTGDVKTEVLAANLSQVTAIRQAVPTAEAGSDELIPRTTQVTESRRSRRPMAVAAGLLGLLLFGGAIAGGIYKYRPFSRSTTNEKLDKTGPVTQPVSNASAPTSNSAIPVANTGANANESQATSASEGVSANVEKSRSQTAAEKPADTTKNNKAADEDKTRGQNEPAPVKNPPDQNDPGEVVITRRNPNGSITTTRMPRNGQLPQNPRNGARVNPPNRNPGWFNPGNLTPEMRRRMREAMRRNGWPVY